MLTFALVMKKNGLTGTILTICMLMFASQVCALNPDSLSTRQKLLLVTGSGWNSLFSGLNIPFTGHPKVKGAAGETHAIKSKGIPALVLSDGPAGVRIKPIKRDGVRRYCTGFPVGTLVASMWDPEAAQAVGDGMGYEALEYGIDVLLAPGVNIQRNPLCGRNYEYYSEDPVLSGVTAGYVIRGIQQNGVGASLKHFACNNQETNRKKNDAIVDSSTLQNIYLKAFEIAIGIGRPWTVMSSYNLLNGERTQESHWLLTDILRKKWDYQGVVMSDWTGTRNSTRQIAAGNDLLEPGNMFQRWQLRRALRKGKLTMAQLDTCVQRILDLVEKTPAHRQYAYSNHPDRQRGAMISRKAATEGMVLLENNGALPLHGIHTVAVYGASAYELIAGGTGSGYVNKEHVVCIPQALQSACYAVDDSLSNIYLKYIRKRSSRLPYGGMGMLSKFMGRAGLRERAMEPEGIMQDCHRCDAAIIVIGRQAGEGRDRRIQDDFNLTTVEQHLIQDVCRTYHAMGKPVVVVLNVSGVVETASWKHLPDAVLCAWCPGQEGGHAIVDILTGRVNPSGRLPMTFPIDIHDLPSTSHFPTGDGNNVHTTHYAEGEMVGYRYFNSHGIAVSYPFGYGLSYTTFSQTEWQLHTDTDGVTWATTIVTNTGDVAGRYVVQYWNPTSTMHELQGYAKTSLLQPHQSEQMKIKLYK